MISRCDLGGGFGVSKESYQGLWSYFCVYEVGEDRRMIRVEEGKREDGGV